MNFIIGDIGNTSTRICVLNDRSKILKSLIFDTKKIYLKSYVKNIFKKLYKKNIRREVLFSCVVPTALKKIKDVLKKTNYKILEIKSLNLKKIIKINIKNIKQLGSDRIVNSVEA